MVPTTYLIRIYITRVLARHLVMGCAIVCGSSFFLKIVKLQKINQIILKKIQYIISNIRYNNIKYIIYYIRQVKCNENSLVPFLSLSHSFCLFFSHSLSFYLFISIFLSFYLVLSIFLSLSHVLIY